MQGVGQAHLGRSGPQGLLLIGLGALTDLAHSSPQVSPLATPYSYIR